MNPIKEMMIDEMLDREVEQAREKQDARRVAIAAAALQGLLANPYPGIVSLNLKEKAQAAVNAACALLAELGD